MDSREDRQMDRIPVPEKLDDAIRESIGELKREQRKKRMTLAAGLSAAVVICMSGGMERTVKISSLRLLPGTSGPERRSSFWQRAGQTREQRRSTPGSPICRNRRASRSRYQMYITTGTRCI